jgi:hypothetical protein
MTTEDTEGTEKSKSLNYFRSLFLSVPSVVIRL